MRLTFGAERRVAHVDDGGEVDEVFLAVPDLHGSHGHTAVGAAGDELGHGAGVDLLGLEGLQVTHIAVDPQGKLRATQVHLE